MAKAPESATPAAAVSTIPEVLNSIQLDSKARASINYAKARCAIESALPCRKAKRAAKLAVVEHLNGTLIHPPKSTSKDPSKSLPNYVLFADNTKARF